MKSRMIVGLLGTVATLAGMAAMASPPSSVLFRFDGAIGSQPLRVGGVSNTVAGVAPGGAPWPIQAFSATIGKDGTLKGRGRGLLLGGVDLIGTRGGPRQVVASLFCRNAPVGTAATGALQTAPYTSAPVDLNPDGDFKLTGTLTNAQGATPPLDCGDTVDNRPVLLIRNWNPANPTTNAPAAAGAWFAAGILKRADDDGDRRD
jgi:hypothetical protein